MRNGEGPGGGGIPLEGGPAEARAPRPLCIPTRSRGSQGRRRPSTHPLPHSWDVAEGGRLHRLTPADWEGEGPLSPLSAHPTHNRFAALADSSDSEEEAEEGRVLEVSKRRLWSRLCPFPPAPPPPRGEEEEEEGKGECPVCLDPLDITAYPLPCGHVFCFACIARHLSQPLPRGVLRVASATEGGGVRSRLRGCPLCSQGAWTGFSTLRHTLPRGAVQRLPSVLPALRWAYKQDGVWWWYAPRVSAALEAAYQGGDTGACVFVGMQPVTVWWDWSARARAPHRRVRGGAQGQGRPTSSRGASHPLPSLDVRRIPPDAPFRRAIVGIAGLWFPP